MNVKVTTKDRVIYEGEAYFPGGKYEVAEELAHRLVHNFAEAQGMQVVGSEPQEAPGAAGDEPLTMEIRVRRPRKPKEALDA